MKPAPFYPYSTAKGYAQSAYAIITNPLRFSLGDDTTFYMSFHMLLGFALELYLKSVLMSCGCSEAELKKPDIRHNLNKLAEKCIANGFDHKGAKYLAEILSEHHKGYGFRYIKPGNEYDRTDITHIFSTFSDLDRTIDSKIGASASKGLKAEGEWQVPSHMAFWRL